MICIIKYIEMSLENRWMLFGLGERNFVGKYYKVLFSMVIDLRLSGCVVID